MKTKIAMKTRSQEEKGDGAVSSIVARLIVKGGSLLAADDLQRLRRLEPAAAEIEELVAEHEALAVALRPHLENLEIIKPKLLQAADMLDDVVERQRQIVDLPQDSNPFFEPSWAGKKFHTVLSTVFHATHAAAPELKNLEKKLHKVQSLIEEADKYFTSSFSADLKGAGGGHIPPKVIGRDAECRKIVAALYPVDEDVDDGRPYSVMGIHGAAGSGKTTLAQCAYARAQAEDEDRAGSFDIFMWVQVGRHFTLHKVFSDMMDAATGRPPSSSPRLDRDGDIVARLTRSLQDELRGKRVLLVLDDVRCNNSNGAGFKQILSPLDVVKAGSKVLLTARSADALLVVGADISSCLPIRDLDDDVFLRLFMHYALGDDGGVDERDRRVLEAIGAGIAAKLERSPLAAKFVGTELRATPQIDVWISVRDTISTA